LWGVIDSGGEVVIPFEWENLVIFGSTTIWVLRDGLWGALNLNNEMIIPFTYTSMSGAYQGYRGVQLNGKWGIVNGRTGEVVVPIESDTPYDVAMNGRINARPSQWSPTQPVGLLVRDRGLVIPFEYSWVEHFSHDLALVSIGGGEFRHGVLARGKWGFADTNGGVAIPIEFDMARSFSEGLAAVAIGDSWEMPWGHDTGMPPPAPILTNAQWGFINTRGELVISHQFDYAGDFNSGLAAIWCRTAHKWGFIDTRGEIAIPLIYDEVRDFRGGFAEVGIVRDNQTFWGVINTRGEIVIPIEYQYILRPETSDNTEIIWANLGTTTVPNPLVHSRNLTIVGGVWTVFEFTAPTLTRREVSEVCDRCDVEKSFSVVRFVGYDGAVTERRPPAKRDSSGNLQFCKPEPCSNCRANPCNCPTEFICFQGPAWSPCECERLESPGLAWRIKQDIAIRRNHIESRALGGRPHYRADEFIIHAYLGTYNGSVALMYYEAQTTWWVSMERFWTESIAGYEFSILLNSPLNRISVWHDGKLYTLGDWEVDVYCAPLGIFDYYGIPEQPVGTIMPGAFSLGLVTEADVAAIHASYTRQPATLAATVTAATLDSGGIINPDGEIVNPPEWAAAPPSPLVWSQRDGFWGAVDRITEEVAVPFEYEARRGGQLRFFILQKDGKWGVINRDTGEIVLPFEFEHPLEMHPPVNGVSRIGMVFRNANRAQFGLINADGELIVPIEYTWVEYFCESGLAAVATGGFMEADAQHAVTSDIYAAKWGFVNTRGEVVIPIQYDSVRNFSDGLAAVATGHWTRNTHDIGPPNAFEDAQWGFIDTRGEIAIPLIYDEVRDFRGGFAEVGIVRDNQTFWGVINTRGEIVIPIEHDYIFSDPSLTRREVSEVCDRCGVEKSFSVVRFVGDDGAVTERRPPAKRDSSGNLQSCKPEPCSNCRANPCNCPTEFACRWDLWGRGSWWDSCECRELDSPGLAWRIKQDVVDMRFHFGQWGGLRRAPDTVAIRSYLGTYNGSIALQLDTEGAWAMAGYWEQEILGHIFRIRIDVTVSHVMLWHDGKIYGFEDWLVTEWDFELRTFEYYGIPEQPVGTIMPGALSLGLVTEADVAAIHARYTAPRTHN
jgi:hypothetical protein